MELLFYQKLSSESKRAITHSLHQTRKDSRPYFYRPTYKLLIRLARESGMTVGQVWAQLEEEREYLLRQEEQISS